MSHAQNLAFWAIILAAGSGSRMTAATPASSPQRPKQFLDYNNAPLFWHSALTMGRIPRMAGLVFVFPEQWREAAEHDVRRLDKHRVLGIPWHVVTGGARRQDSVFAALALLKKTVPHCQAVVVHDSARPFASATLVERICAGLSPSLPAAPKADSSPLLSATPACTGIIPALPVTDTIKIVRDSIVISTPDREYLYAVQTPQAFLFPPLYQAHIQAQQQNWTVTDDASLMELCGHTVGIVDGEAANHKITHAEDIAMLHPSPHTATPCSGFGYDVHRYGVGRPMLLGGVPMPNAPEVIAHSDGDVVLHALMDALLGCACLGDIGQHFPDTAAAYDNISSAVLLDTVLQKVRAAGLHPHQVDITIIAQIPKLSPQRDSIRRNIARLMGLELHCVNVKATTEEGLGFTGAKQGIKAVALVSALRSPATPDC